MVVSNIDVGLLQTVNDPDFEGIAEDEKFKQLTVNSEQLAVSKK
ncbi:MAG: hypothetical protein WBA41_18735 [Rivularia sp. (in: cyanobacteria)]